jgi:hypothetical protein
MAVGVVQEGLDAREMAGVEHLAEPDDVGTQEAGPPRTLADVAAGERPFVVGRLVVERRAAARGAAGLEEVAVDLHEPSAAGADVKAVHVLGDEQEAVAEAGFHVRERLVPGVRRALARAPAPLRVEAPDELGILLEAFGRGHLFDGMVLPEASCVAKGRDAALRGDAGAGEHEEACLRAETEALRLPVRRGHAAAAAR